MEKTGDKRLLIIISKAPHVECRVSVALGRSVTHPL